jgi:hypothetical protein
VQLLAATYLEADGHSLLKPLGMTTCERLVDLPALLFKMQREI